MFAPAISKVREFLSSWKNLLALGTLPLLGAWIYSRVWMVNPAILGDEYLYSMNARKVGPWDPPVAGDFSNYLFNFVYQGTNLCGDDFYACGKIFNIVFFLGFIFTVFILALRFLPFWGAYVFMIAAALSPLSVYTSMFLPESMYFFFIGLVLVALLRAMNSFTWRNWALVGAAIGVASLVKPHAWLSAVAVGIVLLVSGLSNRQVSLHRTVSGGVSLVAGAVSGRVAIGLAVAGPKSLGFFGQYFGIGTVQDIVGTAGETSSGTAGARSAQVQGVLDLFQDQILIHTYSVAALMGLSVMGLLMGLVHLMQRREPSPDTDLVLAASIWLGVLMAQIAIFTGWITGGGDDHSSRVLLRYYDFLFVIVPLAAASFFFRQETKVPVLARWTGAALLFVVIGPGFTGFFGGLTVQIADAPVLAGLIVDRFVYDSVALTAVLGILVFASFPKLAKYAFIGSLPFSLVLTGWQTQDQYQIARATPNAADIVGKELAREFDDESLSNTWILGTSRFEVTNAALWADNPRLAYLPVAPGSDVSSSLAPEGTEIIVTIGEVQVNGDLTLEMSGDSYQVYRVN